MSQHRASGPSSSGDLGAEAWSSEFGARPWRRGSRLLRSGDLQGFAPRGQRAPRGGDSLRTRD